MVAFGPRRHGQDEAAGSRARPRTGLRSRAPAGARAQRRAEDRTQRPLPVRKRKKVQEVSRRLSSWRPRRRTLAFLGQLALGFLVATARSRARAALGAPAHQRVHAGARDRRAAHGRARLRVAARWVPLREISPEMALAVIAAEDQKFADTSGFDWDSIGSVLERGDRARAARAPSRSRWRRISSCGRSAVCCARGSRPGSRCCSSCSGPSAASSRCI